MSDTIERLTTIVDCLGPGLWLLVDGRVMQSVFDGSNEVAQDFANSRGALFVPVEATDSHGIAGKFGRAYAKWLRSPRDKDKSE